MQVLCLWFLPICWHRQHMEYHLLIFCHDFNWCKIKKIKKKVSTFGTGNRNIKHKASLFLCVKLDKIKSRLYNGRDCLLCLYGEKKPPSRIIQVQIDHRCDAMSPFDWQVNCSSFSSNNNCKMWTFHNVGIQFKIYIHFLQTSKCLILWHF